MILTNHNSRLNVLEFHSDHQFQNLQRSCKYKTFLIYSNYINNTAKSQIECDALLFLNSAELIIFP